MVDYALYDVIRAIPQQTQRQYGTDEQLRYLMAAANKLGLYDAADRLRNELEHIERKVAATAPKPLPQPQVFIMSELRCIEEAEGGTRCEAEKHAKYCFRHPENQKGNQ